MIGSAFGLGGREKSLAAKQRHIASERPRLGNRDGIRASLDSDIRRAHELQVERESARSAVPAFELTCFQVRGADFVDRCGPGGIERRSVSQPIIVVSRPGTRLAVAPGAGWSLTNTEVSELLRLWPPAFELPQCAETRTNRKTRLIGCVAAG